MREGTSQGRAFPIAANKHLLTVLRYAERNPVRAKLVAKAQDWRWSSLWHRHHATQVPWLTKGPLVFPANG